MKKKKWTPIVVAIAAVVIVLGIVLATQGDKGKQTADPAVTPSQELTTPPKLSEVEVNATIAKVIQAETFTGEELPLSKQYANAIINAVSYEIVEMKDAGKATVKFKYVDAMMMADMYSGPDDADSFYTYCIESIAQGTAPCVEVTLPVDYQVDEDGMVRIVDSIEFADVLTGGVASELLKLMEGK